MTPPTVDIITLFPEQISAFTEQGLLKHAQTRESIIIRIHQLREWAIDERGTVDDTPYGGGVGMILRVEPIMGALTHIQSLLPEGKTPWVVAMSPSGKPLTQAVAQETTLRPHVVILCGHYEGVDARIEEHVVNESISVGDVVVSGGELPALMLMDSMVRLLPATFAHETAVHEESFQAFDPHYPHLLLEYPQYTKPAEYNGWKVPEVLRSGNHHQISQWKKEQAYRKTTAQRPDLLQTTAQAANPQ